MNRDALDPRGYADFEEYLAGDVPFWVETSPRVDAQLGFLELEVFFDVGSTIIGAGEALTHPEFVGIGESRNEWP